MVIDTHIHVWEISEKYPIGPTAPTWNSYPDESGTTEELLEEMDAHGVDRAVLVQTSWSTWDNGYIADSVARYPSRFSGQGLVDPQNPENAEQAHYWVKERGLSGFRFHPMYYPHEDILTNRENRPLWEEIAALGAIVQFHLRPEHAAQINAVAKRCPDNVLIIDHMGYPQRDRSLSKYQPILDLSQHPNVVFRLSDVAGRSGHPFPYTDIHPFIRAAHNAFGSDRIIWGTGYPGHHRAKHDWPSLGDELALIQQGLPFLNGCEIENILGNTAARIWG
jgi:predicted TIM-barrel fold metal-dependent hydrolase